MEGETRLRARGNAARLQQVIAARARLGFELEALDRKGRTLVRRASLVRARLAEEVERTRREERERAEAAEETRERKERERERLEHEERLKEEREETERNAAIGAHGVGNGFSLQRGTFAAFREEREQKKRQRAAAAGLVFVPPRIKFRQPRTIPELKRMSHTEYVALVFGAAAEAKSREVERARREAREREHRRLTGGALIRHLMQRSVSAKRHEISGRLLTTGLSARSGMEPWGGQVLVPAAELALVHPRSSPLPPIVRRALEPLLEEHSASAPAYERHSRAFLEDID